MCGGTRNLPGATEGRGKVYGNFKNQISEDSAGAKLPLKGTIKMRKIMANTVWSVVYAFKNHPVWTVSYLVSVVLPITIPCSADGGCH